MRRSFLALTGLLLAVPAMAQTAPGWPRGKVPTPTEWNAAFAGKSDYPAGVPGAFFNVAAYGAKCDGVTDDTIAFQAAITAATTPVTAYGKAIYLPAGRCMLSATLVIALQKNQALGLIGAGQDISELVWTSDTDGMTVTATGNFNTPARDSATVAGTKFAISGVSFTRQMATISKTALYVNNNSDNNHGNSPPVVLINDVAVHGSILGGGWSNGIKLYNTAAGDITNFQGTGAYTMNVTTGVRVYSHQGNAIAIDSTPGTYATDFHLSNIRTQGWDNGIKAGPGFVQGIVVNNMVSVDDTIGINWASNGFQDMLAVTNSHFNDRSHGIAATYVLNVTVSNCFFLNGTGAQLAWSGVYMAETGMSAITGNSFQGSVSSATPSPLEWAIEIVNDNAVVTQSWPTTITGNVSWDSGALLSMRNEAKNVMITGNALYTANDLFTDGISLTFSAGPFFYGSNYMNGKLFVGSVPSVHSKESVMPRTTFDRHVGAAGPAPTLSSCGTSPAFTNTGLPTDMRFSVTEGATTGGCIVNFAVAYDLPPTCTVTPRAGGAPINYSVLANAIIVSHGLASGLQFDGICVQ